MNRIPPTLHPQIHLPPRLRLLQIRNLLKMMYGIQVPDLTETRPYCLHYFPPRFQPFTPISLLFDEVSRVEGVGAEFEEAAKLAGGCYWPKNEFLHKGGLFVVYEEFEGFVNIVRLFIIL